MDTAERAATVERDDAHDRFADFERGVLQDNIALCDTKAGLLLAFTSAMVLFAIEAFLAFKTGGALRGGWAAIAVRVFFGVALVGFLISAQFSLTTVMPRINRGGTDHVFWEAPVFLKPVGDYIAAMEALDPAEERRDKLRHLHLLAGICRRKFAHFRTALRLAQVAFLSLALGEILRVIA